MWVWVIVSDWSWLLIVAGRPRHTSSCGKLSLINLVSAHWMICRLWSWIIHLNHRRLCGRLWLRTLSWLISSEAEHVGKVFSELSGSWKTTRGNISVKPVTTLDIRNSGRTSGSVNEVIILWRVHTRLAVVRYSRWMRRGTSWDNTCVGDAS